MLENATTALQFLGALKAMAGGLFRRDKSGSDGITFNGPVTVNINVISIGQTRPPATKRVHELGLKFAGAIVATRPTIAIELVKADGRRA